MKHKINYLGFLSLLALIAILGLITDNNGLYGFFGFAYYLRATPHKCQNPHYTVGAKLKLWIISEFMSAKAH